jgi:hypothetical protein
LLPALRPSCSALLAGLDIFIRVLLPLRLILRGGFLALGLIGC